VVTTTEVRDIPGGVPASTRSALMKSEDWLAVWIGFVTIALVLAGVRGQLPAFGWEDAGDLATRVFSTGNLLRTAVIGGALGVLSAVGVFLMGGSVARFAAGFPVVYVLACAGQLVAGQATLSRWGIEYVIFALVLGLLISNVIGVSAWLAEAVRTEYYLKTGLILLGASMLFSDLMRAGLLGIAQAVLVVTAVWFIAFWLARRLRVDDELGAMLATAVSICGVSAAIAACGAINGDRRKLSYVTSLVILVAAPMMVVMPLVVNAAGIPHVVGGAWLGGTLDTSASVVAAGEVISNQARNAGVVVKLSQNVLIGLAALLLTIWWTLRAPAATQGRAGLGVIWERFPKFVLGFMVASFVFSFLLEAQVVADTKGLLSGLRTAWFALAFTSIGLETRFATLVNTEGGRPALAFLGAQAFNVAWTLLLAYIFFGGWLFAVPDLR
jgi:uncharacterized integral membrane protein (TIGR00698 family)